MGDVSKYILNIPTLSEGCTLSLSNPNFQSDAITYKYVSDSSSTAPKFLLFQRQNDNIYCDSQLISSDPPFRGTAKTNFTSEKEFSAKKASVQYDLPLAKKDNLECDISSEKARRCSDDNGFYSAAEDSVSDIDTNVAKEDIYCAHGRQGKARQEESLVNTEFNRQVQDSRECMTLDALEGQDVDNQSTKALLNVHSALPTKPNSNGCRSNGTTVSLEDDHPKDVHHWYVVVSRLTMKEKLTRRQLIQIAGMTFLGFIFVGLIIIWVFSPVWF